MLIATCSFARFTPDMGVPVRVSMGGAPAGLPFTLRHHAAELSPDPSMIKLDLDRYRSAYRRKLIGYGMLAATNIIRGILLTERADLATTPAVLLSTTDLTRAGAWCSRTMLGEWWAEYHGGTVPELGGRVGDQAYPEFAGLPGGGVDEAGTPSMF